MREIVDLLVFFMKRSIYILYTTTSKASSFTVLTTGVLVSNESTSRIVASFLSHKF